MTFCVFFVLLTGTCAAGVMSGLTIGLLSLDIMKLEVLASGNDKKNAG